MVNHNKSALLHAKSPEDQKSLFQQWSLELVAAVEAWSQTLEDGAFKTHGQCEIWPTIIIIIMQHNGSAFFVCPSVSFITKQVAPLIIKWEWGTTRNFLYQYQGDKTASALNHSFYEYFFSAA